MTINEKTRPQRAGRMARERAGTREQRAGLDGIDRPHRPSLPGPGRAAGHRRARDLHGHPGRAKLGDVLRPAGGDRPGIRHLQHATPARRGVRRSGLRGGVRRPRRLLLPGHVRSPPGSARRSACARGCRWPARSPAWPPLGRRPDRRRRPTGKDRGRSRSSLTLISQSQTCRVTRWHITPRPLQFAPLAERAPPVMTASAFPVRRTHHGPRERGAAPRAQDDQLGGTELEIPSDSPRYRASHHPAP